MQKKKNVVKLSIILAIIIFLIIQFVIAIISSRYTLKRENIHGYESGHFYIKSDLEGNEDNTYNYFWNQADLGSITLTVKNNENFSLYSNGELRYTINAEIIDDIEMANLIDVNVCDYYTGNELTGEQFLYERSNDFHMFTCDFSKRSGTIDLGREFRIKITISANSPYTKQIESFINVKVVEFRDYEFNLVNSANNEYVTLDINVHSVSEDLTISYDNTKLQLDLNGLLLNDLTLTTNNNITSFTISSSTLLENSNYEIIFIKSNNQNNIQLGTDIIVTES